MNHTVRSTARRLAGVAAGLVAAAGLLGAGAAQAWHHPWGPRVGVYVGPGYYYPPSWYYPPPAVVVPAQPQVYIERAPEIAAPAPAAAAPAPAPAQAYYFCAAANAYYPYVRECAGGWQQVAPQPSR